MSVKPLADLSPRRRGKLIALMATGKTRSEASRLIDKHKSKQPVNPNVLSRAERRRISELFKSLPAENILDYWKVSAQTLNSLKGGIAKTVLQKHFRLIRSELKNYHERMIELISSAHMFDIWRVSIKVKQKAGTDFEDDELNHIISNEHEEKSIFSTGWEQVPGIRNIPDVPLDVFTILWLTLTTRTR